jgi:short-subunit dehydrogenase
MNNNLAVIIGVGPGLGLALAKKFHKEEFDICILARNLNKLESYVDQIKTGSGNIFCYGTDVGDRKSLESALKKILLEHGTPELLIYNVSLLRPAVPKQIDYELFIDDFKINVGGMLLTHQVMFPAMKKEGSGTILITGGGLSISPFYELASLGVGKAGLRNLAGSLVQEVKGSGVRLYIITINGLIQADTKFDPELISDKFLEVYKKGLSPGEHEFILQ